MAPRPWPLLLVFAATLACGAQPAAAPDASVADAAGADRGAADREVADTSAADAPPAADPTAAGFDRTRLHELAITVAAADVHTLDAVADRVPATITLDGVTLTNVGVRNKGMSSLKPASGKLSFSIKFDEF